MIGLKRHNGNNYKLNLINCYGEWNSFRSRLKREKIGILDLQKKINIDINLSGFFFFEINIFFYSYNFLQKIKNSTNQKSTEYFNYSFINLHSFTNFPK